MAIQQRDSSRRLKRADRVLLLLKLRGPISDIVRFAWADGKPGFSVRWKKSTPAVGGDLATAMLGIHRAFTAFIAGKHSASRGHVAEVLSGYTQLAAKGSIAREARALIRLIQSSEAK